VKIIFGSWFKHSCQQMMFLVPLFLVLLNLLTVSVHSHCERYTTVDISAKAVGGPGPMGTNALQAGTANTCAITSDVPQSGFVPGQTYTVTATGSTERVAQAVGGTFAGTRTSRAGTLTLQWTAPAAGTTAAFHVLCATSYAGNSYKATTTVNAAGGGNTPDPGGGNTPVTPSKAKCNSITDIVNFCTNNGNNGMIDAGATTDCSGNPCTINNDAATCCKTAAGGAGTGTDTGNTGNTGNTGTGNTIASGTKGTVQVTMDPNKKLTVAMSEPGKSSRWMIARYASCYTTCFQYCD